MSCILLVEDHKDFRQALKHFLELNKINVPLFEASSGEEGVLLARQKKPEIVIMDFFLRGINGLEAAKQIKDWDPKCNIIMLTMFDSKEVQPKTRAKVIKAFVSKSDLYEKLIPAIKKLLPAKSIAST